MPGLKFQYSAGMWWTPSTIRSGIYVEVAKEYGMRADGAERNIQELLESVIQQVRIPNPSADVGEIAQTFAAYMQQLGGGLVWLRCTEGPTSVTVWLVQTS